MLQVCYVIVSTGWDRHAQMAWLSAQSMRLQEPRARIIAVVEGTTNGADGEVAARFAGTADDVLVKTSDVTSPVGKSRFHKMALREYVRGDLLYVDSDTLAVAPLGDVMTCPGEVGAAADFNNDPGRHWFPPELEEPFRQLGWQYPLPYYLNAGVILMRDTPGVHAFSREWIARFQASSVLPHVWDQATFNSALFATAVPHAVLPNRYNAIVVKRNYRFKSTSLLHFFGSAEEQRGTLMEHLLEHLHQTGTFDRRTYEQSIRQRHPWGPRPEPWQLRHSHNYVRAAVAKAERGLERAWKKVASRQAS